MQTKGAGRSSRIECVNRPFALDCVASAEVFGIRIHELPERQDGLAVVPVVREPGTTKLGSHLGKGILCEHDKAGRRKDPEVCPVARAARKAKQSCAGKLFDQHLKYKSAFRAHYSKAAAKGGGGLLSNHPHSVFLRVVFQFSQSQCFH